MRKVTCHECGKRYDYDNDGFCPACGAFNSPPASSHIDADGNVVWVDGLNERNHRESFVHLELHEEDRERRKLKLERPVRQERILREPLGGAKQKEWMSPKQPIGTKKWIWIVLGIILLLDALAVLF